MQEEIFGPVLAIVPVDVSSCRAFLFRDIFVESSGLELLMDKHFFGLGFGWRDKFRQREVRTFPFLETFNI